MKWAAVNVLQSVVHKLENGETPTTAELQAAVAILERENAIMLKRSQQRRINLDKGKGRVGW